MPRIDPAQLLKTLGVLLAPHGGIKSTEEVSRLVQLMQKFSKKLVSKVIYVKILKSSSPELLEAFLNAQGWELLNAWFTDAIKTQNWPLCTELLALLALCPISASRLKENLDQNQAPRLVRQLSCDARVDSGVRHQAGLLLTRWMQIVSPASAASGGGQQPPAPRSLRVTRSVIVPTPRVQALAPAPGTRVLVAVHTSTEEIINMGNMTVSNSGMTTSHNITSTTMSTTGHHPVSVDPFDAILTTGVPQYSQSGAGQVIGVIRNECLDDAIVNVQPVVSPIRLQIRPQPVETNTGGVNILAELSNELSESLKKEVQDEIKQETSSDDKKNKNKERSKDRVKDKDRSKDSHKREKDRHRDRDRDKKDRDKDRERKHRESDEKRRREKERQREKERKEKKPRESKSFREAEVRDGLDSAQKQRIKDLAEKMRQEVKTLPKIPKVPKSSDSTKDKVAAGASGGIKKPSFTDLMNAMGTTATKTVKAAPIKNKNRLLLESLESSETSKPTAKTQQEPKKIDRTEYLLNFKTEDKSALVKSTTPESNISDEKVESKSNEASDVEEKKAVKRPLEEPKLKIKSQSQLSEGSGFSDFLSTIIPDVPKKKKIKFSDLKAQKEAALKETEVPGSAMEIDANDETESSESKSTFSFYGGGNAEDHENTSEKEGSSSPKEESIKEGSEDMEVKEEDSGPREVRGILVINKGAKRSRSIQWRPESKLVEVEYFEVEEGERVNVNKLKFEEQRKKELELEKMRMKNKPEFEADDRPWPLMASITLSCEMPDIEYGGNSKEKKEQQLRETSTLQALFFSKNGPSDPLEPDSGLGARLECRPIPLEDTSGEEEAVNDYSELGWPEPLFDKFMANNPPPPVFVPPPSLLGPPPGVAPPPVAPSATHILQNLIGGGGQIPEGNQQAVDSALFAAQKAAAETLLKQGLLPPVFMDQNVPPESEEIKRESEYMEYEELSQQETKPPAPHHQGGWRGGPPQPQRGQPHRGFGRGGNGPNNRMNNHPGHNNEFGRGGFGGQRGGMHHPPPQRGGNFPQRGFQNRPPNGPRGRPCKFWMETGYCRQENRCKFLHPAGPGGPGVAR